MSTENLIPAERLFSILVNLITLKPVAAQVTSRNPVKGTERYIADIVHPALATITARPAECSGLSQWVPEVTTEATPADELPKFDFYAVRLYKYEQLTAAGQRVAQEQRRRLDPSCVKRAELGNYHSQKVEAEYERFGAISDEEFAGLESLQIS